MNKRRKIFLGYTLLEMLIVMAIFIILAGLGVGGYIGTRETMMARENVQTVLQNVRSARLKAMLFKKGSEEYWIYGIGIDFYSMSQSAQGDRTYFKWCSPFKNFGNDITKSEILGWDSSKPIGYVTSQEIDAEDTLPEIPDNLEDPIDLPIDPGEIYNPPSYEDPQPPSDVLGVSTYEYKNGYLPLSITSSCQEGATSLTYTGGDVVNEILDSGGEFHLISEAKYLVFEAVTGRAFLYDSEGKPLNYLSDGEYSATTLENLKVLDVLIKRKYSSKFDLISIYPLSGTVIHHVYSNADIVSDCEDNNCISFEGKIYKRYGISDEINSYREK